MEIIKNRFPSEDGFYMPAEYERHDGTLMIYPVRPGSWGKDRSGAINSFSMIFVEIMKKEILYLLADIEHMDEAKNLIGKLVKENNLSEDSYFIFPIGSDDAWARDVGPTCVVNEDEKVRAVNWKFNAWGGEFDGLYANWDKDDALAPSFCRFANMDMYDANPFVLEGGSIHTDGEGTLLVTESCLLSQGRNPSLTKQQIEDTLKKYLNVQKVLWLPRGIYNDETNEHVDNVCAFIAPAEVVLAWTDDENDPQYELSKACLDYLENSVDAKGRKITVHKLPIPDHPITVTEKDLANYEFEDGEDMRDVGERLAASYVNFYFINGAALVPQFGGENADSDKRALDILRKVCGDREIIGIPARDILLGGGNIHCITQQIPTDK